MKKPIGYVNYASTRDVPSLSDHNVDYWEVVSRTHPGRYWSVSKRTLQAPQVGTVWTVCNGPGQRLDIHGPTAQAVLDVVHDFERNTERE